MGLSAGTVAAIKTGASVVGAGSAAYGAHSAKKGRDDARKAQQAQLAEAAKMQKKERQDQANLDDEIARRKKLMLTGGQASLLTGSELGTPTEL